MSIKKGGTIGLTVIFLVAFSVLAWGDGTVKLKEGSCQAILTTKCNTCHHLARVCQKIGQKNKRSWKRSLKRMVKKGAKLKGNKQILFTKEEKTTLLECLANQEEGAKAACE